MKTLCICGEPAAFFFLSPGWPNGDDGKVFRFCSWDCVPTVWRVYQSCMDSAPEWYRD